MREGRGGGKTEQKLTLSLTRIPMMMELSMVDKVKVTTSTRNTVESVSSDPLLRP